MLKKRFRQSMLKLTLDLILLSCFETELFETYTALGNKDCGVIMSRFECD